MAETKYIEIYRDGKLVAQEPYQISDDELEKLNARRVVSDLSAKADNEMTIPEIAQFLKALARLG